MKKSFLFLAAIAALGLAACNAGGGGNTPNPGPETPDLPTEEGKVTFWFEMGDDEAAIEVPSYCDVFLTGAFFGQTDWPTAANEVVTMKKLAEDSNIYFGQWEGDYATIDSKDYQLTLGYAADSGAPSTGVNWSYKSAECQAASGDAGLDNLQFTLSEDGLTAALGTHHWEEAPGEVKVVENVTVQLTLAEAAPAWVTLFAPGNFRNNWACDPEKDAMTPNEDRTVWTIGIESVNLGTYEMKVIAEYSDAAAFTWSNVVLDDGAGGNFSLNVLRANANSTIDLNARAGLESGVEFDWSVFPDPNEAVKVDVLITVELAAALDTDVNPDWFVIGNFTSWQAVAMTVAEDKMSLSFTAEEMVVGSTAEFGVCADDGWHIAVKNFKGMKTNDEGQEVEDWANLSFEVAEDMNIKVTVDAEGVAKMNTAVDTSAWVNVAGVLTTVAAIA